MKERGIQKSRIGIVVKDRMHKSVIVEVTRTVMHPLYGKYVRKRNRFMAHDENNEFKIGDKVRIAAVRPLSKRKRWRVREKVT